MRQARRPEYQFAKSRSCPVSSEFLDLCEISDLLLFLSCSTSKNKEIRFGNYFFDVYCANYILFFWLDVRYPQQGTGRE